MSTAVGPLQWYLSQSQTKLLDCAETTKSVSTLGENRRMFITDSSGPFSTLAGRTVFTKHDLKQAYQQLEVDKASPECLTINPHNGLYRYTRLQFGVSSAPSIFQATPCTMDQILQGISNTICYLDDILVMGKSMTEHLKTLEEVLQRLQNHRLRVRSKKCHFLQ